MPDPRLQVCNLSKRFDTGAGLFDVSLTAYAGEVHAICGESGSGKSILTSILTGAITGFDGTIVLDGRPLRLSGRRAAENAGIGAVDQAPEIVPELSVAASIFLGREPRWFGCVDLRETTAGARVLLERLGSTVRPRARVGALKASDRQVVAIARALALEASVVVFDDPTATLAHDQTARLYRVIDDLRRAGVAVLYATRRIDEVMALASRVTVLRDARVVASPALVDTSPRQIAGWMAGREQPSREYRAHDPSGRVVLRVRNLEVSRSARADRPGRGIGFGFELHSREVLGLAGSVGSGRSEVLEVLAGLGLGLGRGEITLEGRSLRLRTPREAIAAGMAYVPADRAGGALFPEMTAVENITIATLRRFAALGDVVNRLAESEALAAQLGPLGLRPTSPRAAVASLPEANRQKCLLGRWMLTRPKVLLLDEPTRGLDSAGRTEVLGLIRRVVAGGMSVVIASGDLAELLAVSDRILVFRDGRVAAELPRAEASEETILRAAGALEALA
jgi:ribose transport system ATP-binding protein